MTERAVLTDVQKVFFARHGYLQLPGCVAAEVCEHLVQQTWRWLPARWEPERAESWVGEVTDSCHAAGLDQRRGHLKYQVKSLLGDPQVVGAFQDPSAVHAAALALVGKPLHGIRLRGLYVIAPPEHPGWIKPYDTPHVEAHPVALVSLCYLRDVPPGAGGLLVWPGSHRAMYTAFDSKFDFVANAAYAERFERFRLLKPIELSGRQGDVILTHSRLLHAPGVNRSRQLRFGFLCDYTPLDYRERCREAPTDALWEDWPGLRSVAGMGDAADAPADIVLQPVDPQSFRFERSVALNPTHSSLNKADASRLARQRRPGDVWLSVSDSPLWFDHNHSLDPQGSALGPAGLEVFLDDERLVSDSVGDVTVLLRPRRRHAVLRLRGIDRPLWVRVLHLSSPFIDSAVLLKSSVAADQGEAHFELDCPADAVDRQASETFAAPSPRSHDDCPPVDPIRPRTGAVAAVAGGAERLRRWWQRRA